MALHELFRDNDGKREYFERAFVQWHERVTGNLMTVFAKQEMFEAARRNLDAASAALPLDQDAVYAARRKKVNAQIGVECAEPRHVSLRTALEKIRADKPDQSEALATILRAREAISEKVAKLDIQTEKHYGSQDAYITMNTNMHLNSLSLREQVTLFEYFNLVQELSKDAPDIIILADEIAKRAAAKADMIGPQLPEAFREQQAASLG